jgi:hypothetical protein
MRKGALVGVVGEPKAVKEVHFGFRPPVEKAKGKDKDKDKGKDKDK